MKINDLRKLLKRNNFLYSTYIKLNDNSYFLNLMDFITRKDVKPGRTVLKEIALMRQYWKCDPLVYFKYRLFEKNLTREEILDYIPPYFFYNVYIPYVYKDPRIVDIGTSKIKQSDYFISKGINTPDKIAAISTSPDGEKTEKMSYKTFIEVLYESGCQSCFMKPDNGKGGKGIHRIVRKRDNFYIKDAVLDEKLFRSLTRKNDFLIQRGVIQRGDFMEIYPHSVNTLRIVTQNCSGDVKIHAAVLRTGTRGHYVDNISSGGVAAMIDIETGILAPNAAGSRCNEFFTRHPDTGFVFGGYKIKDWDRIMGGVKELAVKAPEFPDVAWDIAVTENNLTVLEFNIYYGIDGLQDFFGGLRRKLNVIQALPANS